MKAFILQTLLIVISLGCQGNRENQENILYQVGAFQLTESGFRQRFQKELDLHDPILLSDQNFIAPIKEKVLEEFALEALLLGWDSRQRAPVPDEQVFAKIKNLFPNSNQWEKFDNNSVFFKKMKAAIVKKRLLKTLPLSTQDISEEFQALKKTYWSDESSFRDKASVKLQQIVLRNELQAIGIYKKLKDGVASFDEMARQFSVGPEAVKDGHLGWVHKGSLSVFDEAFQLPELRISKPKKSPYGFHIFRVLDKQKARKLPLDRLKEQLTQKRIKKAQGITYKKWLEAELATLNVKKDQKKIDQLEVMSKKEYL